MIRRLAVNMVLGLAWAYLTVLSAALFLCALPVLLLAWVEQEAFKERIA